MDDAQAVLEEQSGAQRPVACPQRRVTCLPAVLLLLTPALLT
jgi:hypothetical protein